MNQARKSKFWSTLGVNLLHSLFSLFVFLSSFWLCLAIWVQEPFGWFISRTLIGLWIVFAMSVLGLYVTQHFVSRKVDVLLYILIFSLSVLWYFNLDAKHDRHWSPEVEKMLQYERQGNLVTLHNVRNFNWHSPDDYDVHWETRQYDLDQLTGVNIITSYWMGPQIAHTLVSFDFANAKPLTFSIEIRKEQHEQFSAIGGFFRKYEVSLIAADESDIIYTRSNVRDEQVYFFPIHMPKAEMRALFNEYLVQADDLKQQAQWYNTLTSNCTTLVFDMAQAIAQTPLPTDYRLIASGYLPDYLYDLGALDHRWDMKTWYERAHVNPKTQNISANPDVLSTQYSKLIRTGLPKPQP